MAPTNDKEVADQLAKAYELYQSGALTKPQFEQAKQRILGSPAPRMVAQPVPSFSVRQEDQKAPKKITKRGWLYIGVLLLIFAAAVLIDGDDKNDAGMVDTPSTPTASTGTTPAPTVEPTATAIPRTGIQTIHLSITLDGEWKAWGNGCVGSGKSDWVSSDVGAVVSPETESGTFRGVKLGAGDVGPDDRCHWSATLTSRASDAYRITVGRHDAVCHSNMMLPTEGGFFAAVMIDSDGVRCATVLEVSDDGATPGAWPAP